MKGRLSAADHRKWDNLLTELGGKYGATIQLAEVVGKRWHYLAGETGSEAGLLGIIRHDLGNGFGVIIFPHNGKLADEAEAAICQTISAALPPQSFAMVNEQTS